MKVVPLRLPPGDDLRRELDAWMGQQEERAGCVISGIGTLSPDGAHLHIAIAELVLGLLPQWRFSRELDPLTGYPELRVTPRSPG